MWFIHHLCVLLLISSAGSFRAYGNDRVEELVAASRISEPGTMKARVTAQGLEGCCHSVQGRMPHRRRSAAASRTPTAALMASR